MRNAFVWRAAPVERDLDAKQPEHTGTKSVVSGNSQVLQPVTGAHDIGIGPAVNWRLDRRR